MIKLESVIVPLGLISCGWNPSLLATTLNASNLQVFLPSAGQQPVLWLPGTDSNCLMWRVQLRRQLLDGSRCRLRHNVATAPLHLVINIFSWAIITLQIHFIFFVHGRKECILEQWQ